MSFSYGIVMGYYGRVWSFDELNAYVNFCKKYDYTYFIYAPKEDDSLRKNWSVPFTATQINNLKKIRNIFENQGIAFGLGFSPYGTNKLDDKSKKELKIKVEQINTINPSILGVFFDDIEKSSIVPDLGKGQVAVAEYAASSSNASAFITVPTYYSNDQILQRVLGPNPPTYFDEFGSIDQKFNIFWTGEHIISAGFTEQETNNISEKLKRKVTIWDNHPVNDPSYLSDFLRIFALTSRGDLSSYTESIAFNPMIQPYASMLPLATARKLYKDEGKYNPRQAYLDSLQELCSTKLAEVIDQNLNYFILDGINKVSDKSKKRMLDLFAEFTQGQDKLMAQDFIQILQGN